MAKIPDPTPAQIGKAIDRSWGEVRKLTKGFEKLLIRLRAESDIITRLEKQLTKAKARPIKPKRYNALRRKGK